jgi:uncharacterized membrane protein
VNHNQIHTHHIRKAKSTHHKAKAVVNQIVQMIIFTVLKTTQAISQDISPQSFFSKISVNFHLAILAIITVITKTIIHKNKFKKKSAENFSINPC